MTDETREPGEIPPLVVESEHAYPVDGQRRDVAGKDIALAINPTLLAAQGLAIAKSIADGPESFRVALNDPANFELVRDIVTTAKRIIEECNRRDPLHPILLSQEPPSA